MFLVQRRTEPVLPDVLFTPLHEFRDMFDTDDFPRLSVRRDKVMEDGTQIA